MVSAGGGDGGWIYTGERSVPARQGPARARRLELASRTMRDGRDGGDGGKCSRSTTGTVRTGRAGYVRAAGDPISISSNWHGSICDLNIPGVQLAGSGRCQSLPPSAPPPTLRKPRLDTFREVPPSSPPAGPLLGDAPNEGSVSVHICMPPAKRAATVSSTHPSIPGRNDARRAGGARVARRLGHGYTACKH